MSADIQHMMEALIAALIGLGGWIWMASQKWEKINSALSNMAADITRIDEKVNREIGRLEARISAVDAARSESASKIYERLDEISRDQAAQGAQIRHIMDTCNRTNQALMDMLAGRRAGGRRDSDPPA